MSRGDELRERVIGALSGGAMLVDELVGHIGREEGHTTYQAHALVVQLWQEGVLEAEPEEGAQRSIAHRGNTIGSEGRIIHRVRLVRQPEKEGAT